MEMIAPDDLIRFAAEKLDGEAIDAYVVCGNSGYEIDTWELLGKGMAAAVKAGMEPLIAHDEVCFINTHDQYGGTLVDVGYKNISEAPLAFWTAWYRLEHKDL